MTDETADWQPDPELDPTAPTESEAQIIAEWREEDRAALPHLRVQETHGPIGVLGTDVGPFVRCSCGSNPTPKHWLDEHWAGDPTVGKRLVSQFFPSPHPRPVVDREAVVDAVQVSMCGTVNRDNMMERANCEEIADAVLALLPTEEGEGS